MAAKKTTKKPVKKATKKPATKKPAKKPMKASAKKPVKAAVKRVSEKKQAVKTKAVVDTGGAVLIQVDEKEEQKSDESTATVLVARLDPESGAVILMPE